LSARWLIGGYGPDMKGTGAGIYSALTADNGALESVALVAEAASPSFLARRGDHLYAAIEGEGRVDSYLESTFKRDGSAESGGTWPCQLEFVGHRVIAANYFTGTLGVIALDAVGRVSKLGQVVHDHGFGPREEQDGPHAHATYLLDDRTLLGLDLGSDRIELHSVSEELEARGSVALTPGTGPRDIARHASGLLYVVGELSGELLVFEWVDEQLASVASVALPGVQAGDHASGISFGPKGFVYVGLRGSQRISVLRASADGRIVEPVAWVSSEGDWPRHHAAQGDVLHVANEQSDSIASFRLGADGIPKLIADPVVVPSPTFLLGPTR
jgi:6-phosphogluconolactonase